MTASRPDFRLDLDGRAFEFGRFHLAGDGAYPDQLVESRLLGIEHLGDAARQAAHVGRADRLVRFLRVLGLHLIFSRRAGDIIGAVFVADHLAGRGHGLRRHVDAVGAHISNESDRLAVDLDAFVQALRDLHGAGRRETEFSRGFLLQGRRRERCGRIAPRRLGLDHLDREGGSLERLLEVLGLGAGADVEPVDLAAVCADEAGRERRAGLGLQMRD